ncbi:hypothetical protein OEZ86_009744 [Tetradesmus obliquus]|nr:hypothetical protein OEZ86_009744 [Tetradesmus obliquus]
MLADLWALVDAAPLVQQSLRYGNPAFRTWFAAMMDRTPQWVGKLLPLELQGAAVELLPYLLDSFGNPTRIDYGTGHETTFVAFMYCLAALGLVTEADRQALVCVVFNRYLELMRHIQTTYWLEPAGSHGVWGLDDYQFLPFVWGSGQLIGHPLIRPKSIHNEELLGMYGDDYLYLAAVKFVKAVKKGALQETSPMLDDVSSVPSWAKVNSGMVKMYQVEVLSKFPIMQHFLFGSLLPFDWPQVYDNCAAPEKEASHSNSSGQCQAQCSAGGSDNFSRVQRRGHFPGPSHRTCVIGRLLRRRKAQPQRMRMTTGC